MFIPGTVRQPVYRLYQLAWAGLDWIYPPRCGGCGAPGARWCRACQESVQPISSVFCSICGQPLQDADLCEACRVSKPVFMALRSWAIYQGALRKAIHCLKYEGDLSLGDVLARPMIDMLKRLGWQVDLVVPVPISPARKAERGYNQAALLAFPLALGSGIPYRSKALIKIRETRSQVGLNAAQRRENVAEAFEASESLVRDRCVLVVDDVTTTGATMQVCAEALIAARAREVYGLTLARAGGSPDVGSSV